MLDQAPPLRRFAQLVAEMRKAQRRFFEGDKTAKTIAASKDLERQVDRAVRWILDRGELAEDAELAQLAHRVRVMRGEQARYFHGDHDQHTIRYAIGLERWVDRALMEVLGEKQLGLFPEAEPAAGAYRGEGS